MTIFTAPKNVACISCACTNDFNFKPAFSLRTTSYHWTDIRSHLVTGRADGEFTSGEVGPVHIQPHVAQSYSVPTARLPPWPELERKRRTGPTTERLTGSRLLPYAAPKKSRSTRTEEHDFLAPHLCRGTHVTSNYCTRPHRQTTDFPLSKPVAATNKSLMTSSLIPLASSRRRHSEV